MLHKKSFLPNLNNKNKIIKIKEIITINKNLPYYLQKENKYHTPKIYKSRNKFKLLDSNKTISTNLNTINNFYTQNNNYNHKLFSLDEIYAYLYNDPIKEYKKINTKRRILSSRTNFNNKNNDNNSNILIYKKKDYFSKINEIKKKAININYKSPLIHNLYSDFLINKYNTIDFHIDSFKEKQLKINNKKQKLKINENKKNKSEFYDDFKDINLEEKEILNTIKGFLGAKDNKLNQVKTKEDPLFEGIENKINYILDINILPNFKNNLININCNENICNNYIGSGIQHYLSKVRVKYQREKDKVFQKANSIKNINNKENNNNNENNNNENNLNNDENKLNKKNEENNNEINNNDNNENKENKNNENENEKNKENNENNKNKDKDYKLTLYEYEDFFINKYVRYEKVKLSIDKCKKIIYKQVPKKNINIHIN